MQFPLKNHSKFDIMASGDVMLYEVHRRKPIVNKAAMKDFPLHTHRSIEIVVCIEGEYLTNCNSAERIMKKGDVLVAFPYDVYSFTKTAEAECVTIIIQPDFSEKIASLINGAELNNFVHSDEAVDISLEMLKWKGNEESIELYGYIHVLMGILTKKKGEKTHRHKTSFDNALKYISDNYRENITLESTAAEVGVSAEHLSRLFSEKITGGFHRYIQFLRVDYAKQLLSETDKSISEIKAESGFCDQRTFNRVFKSFTSFTPRQYRNKK